MALVAAVAGVVATQGGGSDEPELVFGEVTAASEGVLVRTGIDGDERALVPGDTVETGWTVEATGESSGAIELADGGLVRFDSGARLSFIDLALDPNTGESDGPSRPAIQIGGGRAWLNPPDDEGADALAVQIPRGTVDSNGKPVALDCMVVCSIEAPAGGVTVTTRTERTTTPVGGEVVGITGDDRFEVVFTDGPSDWAEQNIAADSDAGLAPAEPDGTPGIRASAVFGGTFAINFEVVGDPTGAAIPEALTYPRGGIYAITVVADTANCDESPCEVPISGLEGGAGTAEVADGSVKLTFTEQIDCYDESDTTVVVPGIGTTAVEGTLEVGQVEHDGERWRVRSVEGSGTVSATLSTYCNPRDALGTSSSQIDITGTSG